ncbi:ABC transporter ATP-binding protein [Klugiella xanthotipulae]|nr:ABC transporter ATP-binding protein [Klugiella xanthotipulae]
MHTVVIDAINVTQSFGHTHALSGVSVRISRGEAVAMMGTSGSGKTTLLHCLAGITQPTSGTVRLAPPIGAAASLPVVTVSDLGDGERSRLRRERFGFVFQQGLLLPELTAVENAALPLMVAGISRTAAQQHAAHWLAALGLGGLEDRRIGQLSGGQAQRVAIARAQVNAPDVVFADEPTGALDSTTSDEVMTVLLDSTIDRGGALVVVTHDEAVAARCHRVLRLCDGRLVGGPHA